MSKTLYDIFLKLYSSGAHTASLWNNKAAKWVNGRKNVFSEINNKLNHFTHRPVWMHCASLGEFEQGRPLLEAIKINYPQQPIVLTFFSPSGFEVMKDYKGVDCIFYLPMDSALHAKKFLDAVNPSLVLWVKYEYWFYYLQELKKRSIPILLVSGIFRNGQPFFKFYGKIWRRMLASFTHLFVQNDESKNLLMQLGFTDNVSINGDTRFDRVLEIAGHFVSVPFIEEFCGTAKVLVAGSTWEEDEIELLHFINTNPQIKFIIAPHEINKENINDVKDEFPHSVLYSDLQAAISKHPLPNVLIIDNVGMLSRIYKYASVTYVGGGFGADGVHNVLEAAVYGKPVVFGPVYEKFDEALSLIQAGGGISIDGPVKLDAVLKNLLDNDDKCNKMGKLAKLFVHEQAGASEKILKYIHEKRLLTS
ncbi:MAG TPA: glycosyltransferase N-terminal domain-containing protein [Ferruginibacter sp.]|nr:glycosyltransferase N-terminal domain-containing protein [Ferruginibacter sp.]